MNSSDPTPRPTSRPEAASPSGATGWPRGRARDGGVDRIPLPGSAGALWLCGKHAIGPDVEALVARVDATTVVCLTQRHELAGRYPDYVTWLDRHRGDRTVWFPIPDLHVATLAEVVPFVDDLARRIDAGERVVMHCAAGIGRAGTMATCLLIRLGHSLTDALRIVAEHRPMAGPEVGAQRLLVEAYAAAVPPWRTHALAARGFMPADEGDALHAAALDAGARLPALPWVEVGSYCGRSTVWLGAAARDSGTVLYAVDHHRGSEENQAGWEHHDPEVVDARIGHMDTLPFFRATIHDAGLEDHVVAVVGRSPVVAAHWGAPLAFLFIDGGHGAEPARADYAGWAPHVAVGGTLAIHDVFPDPAGGGRPPYEQIFVPALDSGRFRLVSATGSLRILHRVD